MYDYTKHSIFENTISTHDNVAYISKLIVFNVLSLKLCDVDSFLEKARGDLRGEKTKIRGSVAIPFAIDCTWGNPIAIPFPYQRLYIYSR